MAKRLTIGAADFYMHSSPMPEIADASRRDKKNIRLFQNTANQSPCAARAVFKLVFHRPKGGPVFFQLALDVGDHVRVVLGHAMLFARVDAQTEEEWQIVFCRLGADRVKNFHVLHAEDVAGNKKIRRTYTPVFPGRPAVSN